MVVKSYVQVTYDKVSGYGCCRIGTKEGVITSKYFIHGACNGNEALFYSVKEAFHKLAKVGLLDNKNNNEVFIELDNKYVMGVFANYGYKTPKKYDTGLTELFLMLSLRNCRPYFVPMGSVKYWGGDVIDPKKLPNKY